MGLVNNFEQILKDFFFVNHPRQIKKIPQIVKEFKGQEREVMLLLCEKYNVDKNTIEGLSGYTAPAPSVQEQAEEKVEETSTEANKSEEDQEESAVEEVKASKSDKKGKKEKVKEDK